MKIWSCKIGECDAELLPDGADAPMRAAVARAYRELTGFDAAFNFSGWGAELDESERAVVENRAPSPEHYRQWLLQQAAPDLYEALKIAREYMRLCLGSRYAGPDPYPIIDAALAKAASSQTEGSPQVTGAQDETL